MTGSIEGGYAHWGLGSLMAMEAIVADLAALSFLFLAAKGPEGLPPARWGLFPFDQVHVVIFDHFDVLLPLCA